MSYQVLEVTEALEMGETRRDEETTHTSQSHALHLLHVGELAQVQFGIGRPVMCTQPA